MRQNQEEILAFLKKVNATLVNSKSSVWTTFKGEFKLSKNAKKKTKVYFHYRTTDFNPEIRISLTPDPWKAARFNRQFYYADRDWPNIKFTISIHTA